MIAQPSIVTAQLRQQVQPLLMTGERAIAVAVPQGAPLLSKPFFLAIGIYLFFMVGVAFVGSISLREAGSIENLGFMKWFFAVFIFGSTVHAVTEIFKSLRDSIGVRRSVFVLTNRRAIASKKWFGTSSQTSLNLDGSDKIEYVERRDGVGDINFGSKLLRTRNGEREVPVLSFSYIPNVRQMFETAVSINQKAKDARSTGADVRARPLMEAPIKGSYGVS